MLCCGCVSLLAEEEAPPLALLHGAAAAERAARAPALLRLALAPRLVRARVRARARARARVRVRVRAGARVRVRVRVRVSDP